MNIYQTSDEQVIKKETKLRYCKNILNTKNGALVLTTTELYFLVKNKKEFNIPLAKILSVNCQKGVGTGNENMYVVYQEGDQEKKIKIQHFSFMSFGTVGNLSRIGALYFTSWEQAINSARTGSQKTSGTDLNDLKKLATLRDEGVITEEEFTAKKKQLLGL